jgi:hypothetical protein
VGPSASCPQAHISQFVCRDQRENIVLELIKSAIRAREELSFTYSGIARVVQPVAVGLSRVGNDVLRCYQTQGGHVTPGHVWDLCEVALMSNVRGTGNTFVADPPGYKRGDRHMAPIYVEI